MRKYYRFLLAFPILVGAALSSQSLHAASDTAAVEQSIAAGKWQQAGVQWRQLVEKQPARADLHLGYARFLRNTGQLDLAIGEYRKALSLNPNLAEGWIAMSQIALQNFDVENALSAAEKALRADPRSADARIVLISALMQSGRWDAAERELATLLQAQPHNAAVFHLAYQIQLRKGDFARSRSYLQQAVNLRPERNDWMLELCKLLENGGDSQGARTNLKTLLQRKPNDLDARLALARNLEVYEHDFDGAMQEYERALELDPHSASAFAGIERCRVKRNNIALLLKLSLQSIFKR